MATYEGIIDFVARISESGDTRISESGDTRIAEQWNPESVTVDDAIFALWSAECPISESALVSDVIDCQVIFQGVLQESALLDDSTLGGFFIQGSLSESALLTDNIPVSWIAEGVLPESAILTDNIPVSWIAEQTLSESVFVDDSTLGGSFIQDSLFESSNVSDIIAATAIRLYAWLTIEGNETFAVGDILRIKTGEPGFQGDDEWLEVSNIDFAPKYGVLRDKAGMYPADANPAWPKGAAVVNYGQSGDGGIYMTASETNAPYLSIITHAGSPWDTITTHIREGNLNGYAGYSSDIYGWASYIDANNYIKIDPVNGIRMSGEIVITGGSGLSSLSDAGALATEDDLDGVPDGTSYGKVATTSISAGKIVLSETTGDLDDIADGTSYGKVATTAISAGKIIVAGLDSDVTARMFLDSTTKTNIEAWRHASDVTLIDGGDIYAASVLGTVTAGNITLNSSGFIRTSGKDNYADVTSGFFLGYEDAVYKLNLGDSVKYLKWDGTALTIRGTLNADDLTAGTLAVARIAASSIEASKLTISTLSAISADLGSITAGTITMPDTGWIKGGQTDYATGTGFFLGYSGDYKFSVGNSTKYIKWDGSSLLVGGDIITTGNIVSNAVTIPINSFTAANVNAGDGVTYQTATITSTGSPIHIWFSVNMTSDYNGSLTFDVKRVSTVIASYSTQ